MLTMNERASQLGANAAVPTVGASALLRSNSVQKPGTDGRLERQGTGIAPPACWFLRRAVATPVTCGAFDARTELLSAIRAWTLLAAISAVDTGGPGVMCHAYMAFGGQQYSVCFDELSIVAVVNTSSSVAGTAEGVDVEHDRHAILARALLSALRQKSASEAVMHIARQAQQDAESHMALFTASSMLRSSITSPSADQLRIVQDALLTCWHAAFKHPTWDERRSANARFMLLASSAVRAPERLLAMTSINVMCSSIDMRTAPPPSHAEMRDLMQAARAAQAATERTPIVREYTRRSRSGQEERGVAVVNWDERIDACVVLLARRADAELSCACGFGDPGCDTPSCCLLAGWKSLIGGIVGETTVSPETSDAIGIALASSSQFAASPRSPLPRQDVNRTDMPDTTSSPGDIAASDRNLLEASGPSLPSLAGSDLDAGAETGAKVSTLSLSSSATSLRMSFRLTGSPASTLPSARTQEDTTSPALPTRRLLVPAEEAGAAVPASASLDGGKLPSTPAPAEGERGLGPARRSGVAAMNPRVRLHVRVPGAAASGALRSEGSGMMQSPPLAARNALYMSSASIVDAQ